MEPGRKTDLWPFYTVTLLTEKEAERYRQMPVGIEQTAEEIRTVAEEEGLKQILEVTADGFSLTKVRA